MGNIIEFKNRAKKNYTAEINAPSEPIGTAIIHHGYPGSRNSPTIRSIAKVFSDLGLTTVLPNTTHNYSDSDGDYRDMTLAGHCDDLEDCVKSVVDSETYKGPLVIAGHSAGGFSALSVSSRLLAPYRPSLTVASAPLVSGQRFLDRNLALIGNANEMIADKVADYWKNNRHLIIQSDSGPDDLELRWSVMQDWCQHDLITSAVKPDNPTILISGENDSFMPPEDIHAYADTVGLNVQFITDGDHGYQAQEAVFEQTLAHEVQRVLGL